MNFKRHLKNFLFRIGSGIVLKAKYTAPIKTGNLKKDIQVFDDRIENLEIEVGNTRFAPYAKFVHDGTAPHVIKPKRMKALANVKTGQMFGKQGKSPGHESKSVSSKRRRGLFGLARLWQSLAASAFVSRKIKHERRNKRA